MKTYQIVGDNEDWYNFPPNWVKIIKVKANSPTEAIEKAYPKAKKKRWRKSDLRARLVKTK